MLMQLLIALGIVTVCVVFHTTVLVIFGEWVISKRPVFEERPGFSREIVLLLASFGVIMFLHAVSMGIWGLFYYVQGLFPDYETALHFSLASYTTTGYGDVLLPQRWRLLGGVEAVAGIVLCGLSTAFIFAIVNGLFRIRVQTEKRFTIGLRRRRAANLESEIT